ncbi:MAG: hypothetical protein ABFS32_11785 [Bacteroidota bacterium]
MKTANRTFKSLLLGIIVLLALITIPSINASANTSPTTSFISYMLSEEDINDLLSYYSLDNDLKIELLKVEVYTQDFDLIYSDANCKKVLDCDKELNRLINKSDFITDIGNKKIYVLK